ncbi:MAG: trimethylamine methyltransferase family protein [Hyphomicrobiales bacterium]|nr:trimethylamine methyltransferase family protein [Hyphomicrobiales bacterium]
MTREEAVGQTGAPTRRKNRRSTGEHRQRTARKVDYHNLSNPFPPMNVFSDDRIEAMHEAALDVLENLGIKVLLPAARDYYQRGGASVDESTQMVSIGREMVEAALETAPKSIPVMAGIREKDIILEPGKLVFQPGAGAPHATDLERGRRPGTLSDFCELIRLTQHFDVLHMVPPLVEPQDIPVHLRHYETARAQLTLSSKVPFVFSRGTPQVLDSFEMIRDFRGLSDEEFHSGSHCYTIINTNSPRQLDMPMAQGLIDFAKAKQVSIVTPFTLMGAMAPITVAGAITLSHAEALAAITLAQLVNPGAPVCYGTFTSNVDMKSGAPAFGTPEHFRASLAAGQLARKIGLPWRSASGSAANINDAQGANENQLGLWGCLLAGSTVIIHAAGWLEAGLTVSYEKLIADCELLQMIAELCSRAKASDDEIGLDALAEIAPGGHFFGAQHTMSRYQTEFYEPFLHDWTNFGSWTEQGSKDTDRRALDVWKQILSQDNGYTADGNNIENLSCYIEKRAIEGGALPVS